MSFVFYFQVLDECADFKLREQMFVYDYKLPPDYRYHQIEAESGVNGYIHWTYTYLKRVNSLL